MTDFDSHLARLQDLERSCRSSRRLAGIAIAGLCALPLLSAMTQDQKPAASAPVRASAFELVDAAGTVRGRLGFERGGAELRLFDSEGKVRLRLGIDKDSDPLLTLVDREDRNRVSLIYDSNPHIVLTQRGGKPIVHITAGETGAASLLFTHTDGNHNAGIGIHANGEGFLMPRQ